VHPIGGKCFTSYSFCLSYFILMMRKYEIDSSHMNIDLFTMPPEITSATFYMPTWSPFESFWSIFGLEICFPEIFSISRIISFPESKITHTFFFILILFDPYSSFHPLYIEMSQISIFFEALDIKIDRSIITHISML